ncbi:c-type cytochrome [Aliiglaciecola sp. CAU 1673]|uniref:c-type cytochrome n=1 Tax=Aliiglaciecola sp. CAU 1673 TaxID=3032595 RepID=UPI0023DAABDF|nr:c-type cytochrome [Aliiglaciecola sp. CAU 1673]MDF2180348.1 c-type cytochrome [Aliiglaciecola sp. CAU 1673]
MASKISYAFGAFMLLCGSTVNADTPMTDAQRGKYLLQVGGCNDCHTMGYAQNNGRLPEEQWLTGSNVGFMGPWGTTYPGNLRKRAAQLSAKQWQELMRSPMRPPMPTPSLAAMSDADIQSIYHYLRTLGDAGDAAPAALPPGVTPNTAYFDFVPKSAEATKS